MVTTPSSSRNCSRRGGFVTISLCGVHNPPFLFYGGDMALDEIRRERLKKLNELRVRGENPYPASVHRTLPIGEALKKFVTLARAKKKIALAGRVVAKREHGGAAFCELKDGTGRIQILLKEDILGDTYSVLLRVLDIGDFLFGEGKLFKTKRGEMTLEISAARLAAKSLLPLPEKWHGLRDAEERFRKRYLDLLSNDETRERFVMRSRLIVAIRGLMEQSGFLEVETPILQPIPGGALARPFVTHHNALDIDLYLRVAPELYLKRLLVGGLEKVYEIGKCFRNEGIDVSHNPEFTMLECYAAYWDEEDMMKFVESFFLALVKAFGTKGAVMFDGKEIKSKKPFARISFKELLSRYAQIIDYDRESRDSLAFCARALGVDAEAHESKGKIADEIYKKICRPNLLQPTFVVYHPLEISPLAKKRDEHQDEVRRFQLVVAGMEIMNGFAELNDPIEQYQRFAAQEKEGSRGGEEAHPLDEDFIEALEYGMPPAAGLGIGIDRLVMLLADVKNIREVTLFPTMRPKV